MRTANRLRRAGRFIGGRFRRPLERVDYHAVTVAIPELVSIAPPIDSSWYSRTTHAVRWSFTAARSSTSNPSLVGRRCILHVGERRLAGIQK